MGRDGWLAAPGGSARPLVVVEGAGGSIDPDIARALAAGFDVVPGFRRPGPRRRPVVLTGTVSNDAEAVDALLAAIDGAGLIVVATADRSLIDRFVDDLRRLGPVVHRTVVEAAPEAPPAEARAIIALLAEGLSLGEAAESLGLARRTADRRLAEARRLLGVERTTEAIARARRLGWLQPSNRGNSGRDRP
ncbi:MAG TPA: hypothetical protein VFX65_05270 [Candidatus Limnocylindrales bacterium]|nr:hypothetical protein [Candidatus Limnocylindrales bacterium]